MRYPPLNLGRLTLFAILASLLLAGCGLIPAPTQVIRTSLPATSVHASPAPETLPAGISVTPTAQLALPTSLSGSHHGDSFDPRISPDGRYVVFASRAGDLLDEAVPQCPGPGRQPPNCTGIFVYDRLTNTMERVSKSSQGMPANSESGSPDISADGRWVVFDSEATNLTAENSGNIFIHDRQTGTTEMVGPCGGWPTLSVLAAEVFE